jgi:hypothetical protein
MWFGFWVRRPSVHWCTLGNHYFSHGPLPPIFYNDCVDYLIDRLHAVNAPLLQSKLLHDDIIYYLGAFAALYHPPSHPL